MTSKWLIVAMAAHLAWGAMSLDLAGGGGTGPSPDEQAVAREALARNGTDSACTREQGSGVCWDLAACAIADAGLPPPYSCTDEGNGKCGASDDFKRRPRCYVWGEELPAPTTGNRTSWDVLWNNGGHSSFVAQVIRLTAE